MSLSITVKCCDGLLVYDGNVGGSMWKEILRATTHAIKRIYSPLLTISLCLAVSATFAVGNVAAERLSKQVKPRETEVLTFNSGDLWVRWDGIFMSHEKSRLREWLTQSVDSITTINGQLPLPTTRVVIEKTDQLSSRRSGRSPVPWGDVIRDGVEGVRFVVDLSRSQDELLADWTASHEFSHLFLPYLSLPDRWLSEGFASYYQNLAMARAGVISPKTAWENLYHGFERADRDKNNYKTLEEVSTKRRALRATMRVYWSGALFFLQADAAVRERYPDKSLDSVVTEFNYCCRYATRHWSGKALMSDFDRIVGEPLFVPLYNQYRESLAIPDYQSLMEELGLHMMAEDMQLDISSQSVQTAIRDAIMAPRQRDPR
ncbi:M61 family metallopeptidase [Aurantivibrio plasticivorans]